MKTRNFVFALAAIVVAAVCCFFGFGLEGFTLASLGFAPIAEPKFSPAFNAANKKSLKSRLGVRWTGGDGVYTLVPNILPNGEIETSIGTPITNHKNKALNGSQATNIIGIAYKLGVKSIGKQPCMTSDDDMQMIIECLKQFGCIFIEAKKGYANLITPELYNDRINELRAELEASQTDEQNAPEPNELEAAKEAAIKQLGAVPTTKAAKTAYDATVAAINAATTIEAVTEAIS